MSSARSARRLARDACPSPLSAAEASDERQAGAEHMPHSVGVRATSRWRGGSVPFPACGPETTSRPSERRSPAAATPGMSPLTTFHRHPTAVLQPPRISFPSLRFGDNREWIRVQKIEPEQLAVRPFCTTRGSRRVRCAPAERQRASPRDAYQNRSAMRVTPRWFRSYSHASNRSSCPDGPSRSGRVAASPDLASEHLVGRDR